MIIILMMAFLFSRVTRCFLQQNQRQILIFRDASHRIDRMQLRRRKNNSASIAVAELAAVTDVDNVNDDDDIIFNQEERKECLKLLKNALKITQSGKAIKIHDEKYYLTVLQRCARGDSSRHRFERQEFLGDAILDLVVSHNAIEEYQTYNEGNLTVHRAQVVSRPILAHFARSLGFEKFVYIENKATFISDRVLADCFEAFIGAIFLDTAKARQGNDGKAYLNAKDFILGIFENFGNTDEQVAKKVINYKGQLMQLCIKCNQPLPNFDTMSESGGWQHKPRKKISITCFNFTGNGSGYTKLQAQQSASYQIFLSLKQALIHDSRSLNQTYRQRIRSSLLAVNLLDEDVVLPKQAHSKEQNKEQLQNTVSSHEQQQIYATHDKAVDQYSERSKDRCLSQPKDKYEYKNMKISTTNGMIDFISVEKIDGRFTYFDDSTSNFKGCLQNICQQCTIEIPRYTPIQPNTADIFYRGHEKGLKLETFIFQVEAFNFTGRGVARNKVKAQHAAAFQLLIKLKDVILNGDTSAGFSDMHFDAIRKNLLIMNILSQEEVKNLKRLKNSPFYEGACKKQ
uniref:RNase III domain-containing protein n=1 Tax=Aureoumbra lagunensis TaxID=44058 RepID=A0A7S3K0W4_9STRA|mmetsp:Transcript_15090/g.22660  ORF Transcript_15090/g.22660 Transcript_15090/m.22660 type:complete len:570 (-) Transcript_15090:135-1844(-)